ncbi:MAG: peptide antibiotic transporter SbmA [Alphaproteobacteria bacterium]|nr:peptide antibiotic transporter SbmA [Alphaproteobacteria bacterium]
MFESFFPRPKLFLISVLVWTAISVSFWFSFGGAMATAIGLPFPSAETPPVIGVGFFLTNDFLVFYLFYILSTAIFAGLWFRFSPHKWQWWSIVGSSFILFSTYFGVQVSVAINHWRKPFFDQVQFALSGEETIEAQTLYDLILIFAQIAFIAVAVYVFTRFFVSHYIFRWRNAMNDFYLSHWKKLRGVEGASQRVQEDTKAFAGIMEGLGVSVVDAIMTLFAFLPVLYGLSSYVTELPIFGEISNPLMVASITWAIFGTILLAAVGIKLPGLEFRNQRVEAAFRKELVYGEDDEMRAKPVTVTELFDNLRRNYFRLYFHYMYIKVARSFYNQADNIFAYIILIPTIVGGTITLGILQQILTAFGQVSNSFQYIVNSWTTIIELISIRKRLVAFEAVLQDKELPMIDQDYNRGIDPDAQ